MDGSVSAGIAADVDRCILWENGKDHALGLVTSTALRLSIVDPISHRRIREPARTRACRHAACFDLQVYLETSAKSGRWTCPVPGCRTSARIEELVVDEYFRSILDRCEEDTVAVDLLPDGRCRKVRDEANPAPARAPRDVIALDESDDEGAVQRGASETAPAGRASAAAAGPEPSATPPAPAPSPPAAKRPRTEAARAGGAAQPAPSAAPVSKEPATAGSVAPWWHGAAAADFVVGGGASRPLPRAASSPPRAAPFWAATAAPSVPPASASRSSPQLPAPRSFAPPPAPPGQFGFWWNTAASSFSGQAVLWGNSNTAASFSSERAAPRAPPPAPSAPLLRGAALRQSRISSIKEVPDAKGQVRYKYQCEHCQTWLFASGWGQHIKFCASRRNKKDPEGVPTRAPQPPAPAPRARIYPPSGRPVPKIAPRVPVPAAPWGPPAAEGSGGGAPPRLPPAASSSPLVSAGSPGPGAPPPAFPTANRPVFATDSPTCAALLPAPTSVLASTAGVGTPPQRAQRTPPMAESSTARPAYPSEDFLPPAPKGPSGTPLADSLCPAPAQPPKAPASVGAPPSLPSLPSASARPSSPAPCPSSSSAAAQKPPGLSAAAAIMQVQLPPAPAPPGPRAAALPVFDRLVPPLAAPGDTAVVRMPQQQQQPPPPPPPPPQPQPQPQPPRAKQAPSEPGRPKRAWEPDDGDAPAPSELAPRVPLDALLGLVAPEGPQEAARGALGASVALRSLGRPSPPAPSSAGTPPPPQRPAGPVQALGPPAPDPAASRRDRPPDSASREEAGDRGPYCDGGAGTRPTRLHPHGGRALTVPDSMELPPSACRTLTVPRTTKQDLDTDLGYPEGHLFESRSALSSSGVHRHGRICGWGEEGAASILVNGEYEDVDEEDRIVCTGHGQVFAGANMTLTASWLMGMPLRVVRGPRSSAPDRPKAGVHKFVGMFRVASAWTERDGEGHPRFKFELRKVPREAGGGEGAPEGAAAGQGDAASNQLL
eukprot:tig00020806_g14039.t1